MTIHLLFITITIERRRWTREELERDRAIRQVEEELVDRKCTLYQPF